MDSVVNGANFDSFLRDRYVGDSGFPGRERIDLSSWVLDTGAPIPAAGADNVGYGVIASGETVTMNGLIWDDTADQTDIIRWRGSLPWDYRRSDETTDSKSTVILRVLARKREATADGNTDLKLVCNPSWWAPSWTTAGVAQDGQTAFQTVTTPISKDLVTSYGALAAEQTFRWFEFDLFATANFASASAAATARRAITPGSALQLQLYPNEAVSADMFVEVLATELMYTRHLTPREQYDRRKVRISS